MTYQMVEFDDCALVLIQYQSVTDRCFNVLHRCCVFRLDALALSVIATATWLGGWVAGCHTPVLHQNR